MKASVRAISESLSAPTLRQKIQDAYFENVKVYEQEKPDSLFDFTKESILFSKLAEAETLTKIEILKHQKQEAKKITNNGSFIMRVRPAGLKIPINL